MMDATVYVALTITPGPPTTLSSHYAAQRGAVLPLQQAELVSCTGDAGAHQLLSQHQTQDIN
jgi:hypothetical protein